MQAASTVRLASLPARFCTQPEAEAVSQAVHLPWNLFICEGLLKYGFRSDAARLVAHIMTGIIQNLKQNRAFYARYHAEKGTGMGERNALNGLAPVGLFLRVLGVEILSGTRVKLEGTNPFPWDVTINYKGLESDTGTGKDRSDLCKWQVGDGNGYGTRCCFSIVSTNRLP